MGTMSLSSSRIFKRLKSKGLVVTTTHYDDLIPHDHDVLNLFTNSFFDSKKQCRHEITYLMVKKMKVG